MPVTGKLIAATIVANCASKGIKGRDIGSFADAVGSSVAAHVTSPNMVSCTLAGTAGPTGTITSLAVTGIVSKAMSAAMLGRASVLNLTGREIAKLFDGVSSGISQILSGMILSGTALGCATGTGTGKFTALNSTTLSKLMRGLMTTKNMRGRDTGSLCDCMSFGVVTHLKSSATFTVLVAGAVAPTPPVGPLAVAGVPSITTKVS